MGAKRRSEMWISNNRVLVGGNKKFSGRNPNFDTEETKLLISLWGDPKIQKTLITTHKKHPVIVKLAERMRDFGYHRSPEEINTRIKNLKCFYNRIKKDIEIGLITEPTWKHFGAMDEIMMRPIFSVRPDEIPKPSPRFQMESEPKEEDSDSKNDGDSSVLMTDDEEESFTQEMLESEMVCEDEDDDNEQESHEDNTSKETTSLIVPKDEPIDVDNEPCHEDETERDVEDATDIFPKLSAYLQLTSSNASSGASLSLNNKFVTTTAGSGSTDLNTSIANAIKIGQPLVFAKQQPTINQQTGKISLVPTNFLLKPHQANSQQIQLRPQTTQHILYRQPTVPGGATITPSAPGQVQTRMKVLLVNALQKGTPTTTTTTDTQGKTTTMNTITMKGIPSTTPIIDAGHSKPSIANSNKNQNKNGQGVGFKTLLTQLIEVQNQTLEVSKQRLEVERQRLDFEKSIAERIITALPNIFPPASNNTMNLLKPKIEKEE